MRARLEPPNREVTMTARPTKPSGPKLLNLALTSNAAFSGLSGLVLVLAAEPAARWLGVPQSPLLLALGFGLLAFAVGLAALARSPRPSRPLVMAATGSDFAWVVGSAVLLVGFPDLLSPAGELAVTAVALVVAGLGCAQVVGLRRA